MGLFGKKKSGKDWFDDGNNFYEQENFLDWINVEGKKRVQKLKNAVINN